MVKAESSRLRWGCGGQACLRHPPTPRLQGLKGFGEQAKPKARQKFLA